MYFIDPDGMEAEASGGGGMSDQLDVDTELEIDAGTDAGYGRKITASNRTMAVTGNGAMGDFRPDKNGNLIVEKGDNAEKLLKEYGVKVTDKNFKFEEGNVIKLDNNMTRSIERSKGVTYTEMLNGSNKSVDGVTDKYICDQATMMAINGEEITVKNAEKNYSGDKTFFSSRGYTSTTNFNNSKMGKAAAVIGGEHVVAYYGKSNNGTVYVYSKDGRSYKPEVKPLNTVIQQMKTSGLNTSQINYYNKQ